MRRPRGRQNDPLERPPTSPEPGRRPSRPRFSWHLLGTIILVTLLVTAFSAPALGTSGKHSFADVPADHEYAQAVSDLYDAGIIKGISSTKFGLDDLVKRAQFAKMILGTLGVDVDKTATATPFVDVQAQKPDGNGYPHCFIREAYNRGITRGTTTDPRNFSPWREIKRDQVVTMIIRGIDNMYPGLLSDPPAGTPSLFVSEPAPHGPNLRKAEYHGLLDGLDKIGLGWSPYAEATRGEVAQMLWNFLMMPKEPGAGEVWVYADGSGDYTTLEAAVAAVPRGTRINLGEGAFALSKTLQVNRPLALVGKGSSKTTVTCSSNTVRVAAGLQGTFSAQDILFRTTSSQKDAEVMTVEGGDVRLLRCSLTGAGIEGNGLSAYGETVHLVPSGLQAADGPMVFSGPRVDLRDCVFKNNRGDAIFLWQRATAQIEGCQISDNGGWGIYCQQDEAETLVKNTSIGSNRAGGLIACATSHVELKNVTCSNNGQDPSSYGSGIVLTQLAGGVIESCTVKGNRVDGILCEEHATLLIRSTKCLSNRECGISVVDDADSSIENCECGQNGSDGIYLADHANSYMTKNYCYQNDGYGIYCDGWSTGTMRNNTFSNNGQGAFLVGPQSTVSGQKPPGG